MASSFLRGGAEVEPDERHEIPVAEFGQVDLAPAGQHVLGHPPLRFDELIDSLFYSATAHEFVHEDVALLPDAEGAVGRLVLDRRIPPAVEMHDMRGGGQVEA